MDGLFFDFEAVRTESRPRRSTPSCRHRHNVASMAWELDAIEQTQTQRRVDGVGARRD